MKMDLAIRNGFLFDGAGNPARKTDIGIHDGRIARIGRIAETEAERTVGVFAVTSTIRALPASSR